MDKKVAERERIQTTRAELQRDITKLQKRISVLEEKQKKAINEALTYFSESFLEMIDSPSLARKLVGKCRSAGLIQNGKLSEKDKDDISTLIANNTADLICANELFPDLAKTLEPVLSEAEVGALASIAVGAELLNEMNKILKEEAVPAPRHELWSDQELMMVGRALWERSYKLGGGDAEARLAALEMSLNWGEAASQNGVVVNEKRIQVIQAFAGFAAKWAVHAFQRITTSHTYAAALMCSDADRAVLEDIELQWRAFMVMLPVGLLSYTDEQGVDHSYSRVLIASYDESAILILLNQSPASTGHRIVGQVSSSIASLLDIEDIQMSHTIETGDVNEKTVEKVRRVVVMAKRLVAGLLLALQHQDNFKMRQVPARRSLKGRERDEPAHRIVFVGKPLKIDCRASIKDFIEHGSPKRKGAPPSVQCVVRGHFKRQVVGVGRTGRKVLWISPYWRGPEDAPILTRPKHVVAGGV